MIVSRNVRGRKSTTNKNVRVRECLRVNNVTQWQLAEEYGLTESKFSVLLRHELPEDTQDDLISLIGKIVKEREIAEA